MEKKRFLVRVRRAVDQVGQMMIYAENEQEAAALAEGLIEEPDGFPTDAVLDPTSETWVDTIEELS